MYEIVAAIVVIMLLLGLAGCWVFIFKASLKLCKQEENEKIYFYGWRGTYGKTKRMAYKCQRKVCCKLGNQTT